jgi:hypothetical protein
MLKAVLMQARRNLLGWRVKTGVDASVSSLFGRPVAHTCAMVARKTSHGIALWHVRNIGGDIVIVSSRAVLLEDFLN